MRIFSILLLITCLSCNKHPENEIDQGIEDFSSMDVAPFLTDSNYSDRDKDHYILRNNTQRKNTLVVFIGGTYSTPKNYNLFCNYAASIGFDVISISYPNQTPAASLANDPDSLIFDKYREEICFGNNVSSKVEVDSLNAITTRLQNILKYLHTKSPDEGWDQYLTTSQAINWQNIVVAGHSQGAGHACFIANKLLVRGVVMFSGPNDFSDYHNQPAKWLSKPGLTPMDKHYSLLHAQDQIVPFEHQTQVLRSLGLLEVNEKPTAIDFLSPPYNDAHALSISIKALSNHNAPVGGDPILPDAWTYILNH